MVPFPEFTRLSAAERMHVIIKTGDAGDSRNFSLLRYAIQHDRDIHVKFAALKRIHHFKSHPDAVNLLTEMKNNGEGKVLEPYFSMALLRLEMISPKEFEDAINNGA